MSVFQELISALDTNAQRTAFFIQDKSYTYAELARSVSAIRKWLQANQGTCGQHIGVIAEDDLLTYASILAIWAEGKAYVPIMAHNPPARNRSIVDQAGITTALYSGGHVDLGPVLMVDISTLDDADSHPTIADAKDEDVAYILFTSGTTGQPKGVPISRGNVAAFSEAFNAMDLALDHRDRCLQMFDLTFDLSVMSFLIPLLKGACVYTVPPNEIKFAYISALLEDHALSIALMVPNMINNLRPYFHELDLPAMRYSLFCGEALPEDVTVEWSVCVPNARIFNVYGPTENTIFCTAYEVERSGSNKTHNGILSIGKAMVGTTTMIVDGNNSVSGPGESGELCLAGTQLTTGYLNDPKKNEEAFFTIDIAGSSHRAYRTGDICLADDHGDIMYLGRTDQQVKILGFRVELSEIEFHARTLVETANVVALAVNNAQGSTTVELVLEQAAVADARSLITSLRELLPSYMVPTKVHSVEKFPVNVNGKIDRKKLAAMTKHDA